MTMTMIVDCVAAAGTIVALAFGIFQAIVYFREKKEKNRPCLEVSFELVRSTLACLVIRNVGNVPARLSAMNFNPEFTSQLKEKIRNRLNNKRCMDVPIFPNRQWILALDTNINEITNFNNSILKIEYEYTDIRGKSDSYKEEVVIDFKEYKDFLLYLSEVDELKKSMEDKFTEVTTLCDKIARNM